MQREDIIVVVLMKQMTMMSTMTKKSVKHKETLLHATYTKPSHSGEVQQILNFMSIRSGLKYFQRIQQERIK